MPRLEWQAKRQQVSGRKPDLLVLFFHLLRKYEKRCTCAEVWQHLLVQPDWFKVIQLRFLLRGRREGDKASQTATCKPLESHLLKHMQLKY